MMFFLLSRRAAHNSLSGCIPTEIGLLVKLRVLDLSYNSIGSTDCKDIYANHTYAFPEELENCTDLQVLCEFLQNR